MLKRIEKLTPAEEAILAAVPDGASGERGRAATLLRERGLPGRKVEAWHYTDLRVRLKTFAGLAAAADAALARQWLARDRGVVAAACLPFVNGRFAADLADALPAGVAMTRRTGQGAFRDATDAVALLNTLICAEGVDLAVDAGAAVARPIEILAVSLGDGAAATRHRVTVGAGARATLIERAAGGDGLAAQSNTVTDLAVGADADLTWVIVQAEGDGATHLAQLNVMLGAGARLRLLVVNAGGVLVRREINVAIAGPGSELTIRGVNLVGAGAHVDVTSVLLHDAPGAVSTEIFRNVATGHGTGAFQGQIRVAPAAQKTDARMACNTLLLSDTAEFSAKPELEIFADDVQCGHGATVADIDDDHLFYLMTRGIPEREGRAMLIRAFVEEAFDTVEDEALRDGLNARIENWLERHG